MEPSRAFRVTLGVAAFFSIALVRADAPPKPPPLQPGLTEGVESRLIQFEVRVTRKGAPVGGLTTSDFDIELGGKPLRKFTVDDMCGAATALPGAPAPRTGGFILYFDEPELTVDGKNRAVEVARLVAPALLSKGHELLILRNGDALRTEANWTRDPAVASAALDRIAADPGNGDVLRAQAEQVRMESVLDRVAAGVRASELQTRVDIRDGARADNNPVRGPQADGIVAFGTPHQSGSGKGPGELAADAEHDVVVTGELTRLIGEIKPLVHDDLRRTERDMERLSGVVRYLALRDAPKGIVYFADTLRRDPGAGIVHTLNSAAHNEHLLDDPQWNSVIEPWNADNTFQALVRESSTYGVRFYAVEGRGLSLPSDWVRTSQDTLASMALETGGLSFLNGIAPERIADRLAADQSCWYLVSFDPSGWDTDRPLKLGVSVGKDGLRVQTRTSLVVPSRATLTETRLVAAHFGDPAFASQPLSVSVYPIGGTTRSLEILAQVEMPAGGVPAATDTLWDVGVDLVSAGIVVARTSSHVTWRGHGEPPVYQATLSLPEGPYEIVAVAHEKATDSIRAGRVHGAWPPSPAGLVTLSVPALAQPRRGGILLDDKVKASGIVVRGPGSLVDPRASVAFVTAACIEGKPDARIRAERRIVGESEVSFDPMTLTPDDGRCVQIRDLVKANVLGAGGFTYTVRVLANDAEIASEELPFAVAPASAAASEIIAPPSK